MRRKHYLTQPFLAITLFVIMLTVACQSGGAISSAVGNAAATATAASARPITTAASTLIPTLATATATPDVAVSNAARGLQGYVAADDSGAVFITWTESGGTLSGTMQVAQPDLKSQSGVQATSASFTGTRSGNHVTLTIPQGLGIASTIAGEFNGPLLTLYFPQKSGTITPVVFHSGTAADYNQAVIALQQQVKQQVAQTQAAQATTTSYAKQGTATANVFVTQQENVRKANAQVANTLRQLTSAVNDLAQDSTFDFPIEESDQQHLQAADQQLRKDAAKQLVDCTQIQFDLDNVELYASPVSDAHSSLQAQVDRIQRESAKVRALIETLQQAYGELGMVAAANTTGAPAPQFTQEDITKAVNAAQQQIDRSTQAIHDAQQRLTGYEQQGAQTLKDAKSFVAGLKCS